MEYLAFQVAGEGYGVILSRVREVSSRCPVTRVPGAPPALLGVASLRGTVIPVVDVAARVGRPATSAARRAGIVYVNALVEGAPAIVGLIVDALDGIRDFAPGDVLPPPPGLRLAEEGLLAGLGRLPDGLLPLLDVDGLVAPARLAATARKRDAAPSAPAVRPPSAEGPAPSSPPPHVPLPAPEARRAPQMGAARPAAPPPVPPAARPAIPPAARPTVPPAARPAVPPAVGRSAHSIVGPRVPTPLPAPAGIVAREPEEPAPARGPGGRRAARLGGAAAAAAAVLALLYAASAHLGPIGAARPAASGAGGGAPRSGEPAPAPPVTAAPVQPAPPGAPLAAAPVQPVPHAPAGPPPREAPASAVLLHEVRRGDTLWALSRRYYGNPFLWPAIFADNRDRIADPDVISPRERLRIPARP